MPLSITTWKKLQGQQCTVLLLLPSRGMAEGMVGVLGLLCLASMLVMTSGKRKSRSKSKCFIPIHGRGRAITLWRVLFPHTGMLLCPSKHARTMSPTSCQMVIQEWATCWMPFSVLILDCKLLWLLSGLTRERMG